MVIFVSATMSYIKLHFVNHNRLLARNYYVGYFYNYNQITLNNIKTEYSPKYLLKDYSLIHDPVYRVTENVNKHLHHRYDSKTLYSWVVKLDPISFSDNMMQHALARMAYVVFFECLLKDIKKLTKFSTIQWLGVIENNRSLHLHLVAFSNYTLTKTEQIEIHDLFGKYHIDIVCDCREHDPELQNDPSIAYAHNMDGLKWTESFANINFRHSIVNLITTFDKIKSPSGYINYLTKQPLAFFHTTQELGQYFVNFDKTLIFTKDSVAKMQLDKGVELQSNKPLIILLFNLFNKGYSEYSDILQVPAIQNYLHMPQLQNIFKNCIQQYMSTHIHLDFLINIAKTVHDMEEECFCPVIEWCDHQNLDIVEFMTNISRWLNGIYKKNTLLFLGTPNGGKSHIARLIWLQFPFHKRIIQDGIFTFANLFNCGCALWEEPFIAPDLADTTKLILEGEANINIAIKNQNSQCLNKRVPIIITSNHPIHRYCSGEANALAERYFLIDCPNPVLENDFCKANNHICPNIGTTNSTVSCFARTSSHLSADKRRRSPSPIEADCSGIHKLESRHIQSFLIHSLINNIHTIEPFGEGDKFHSKEQTLQNLLLSIRDTKNTLCYCSRNLVLSASV